MLRWIALQSAGKKGERLYPGNLNPEISWDIDSAIEVSDSYLNKGWDVYMQGAVSDDKAKEIVSTTWNELLTKIEKLLKKNPNPNFLIGNSLTTADCAYGAYLLKWTCQDKFAHKNYYEAEVQKFPKVKYWRDNTIKKVFGAWFSKQPLGLF